MLRMNWNLLGTQNKDLKITYISRLFLTQFSSTGTGKRFWRTPIRGAACPPQTFMIKSIPKLSVFLLPVARPCSLSSIFISSCSPFDIISTGLFRSGHALIDNGKLSCHFRACPIYLPRKQVLLMQGFYHRDYFKHLGVLYCVVK